MKAYTDKIHVYLTEKELEKFCRVDADLEGFPIQVAKAHYDFKYARPTTYWVIDEIGDYEALIFYLLYFYDE